MSSSDTPSTPSPIPSGKSSAKRYWVLMGLVLVILVGWAGFWIVSKNKPQELIDKVLARQINGQQVAPCTDQTLGGFPFRLLLTCSSYALNDPKSGWQIQGVPLRAVWQIYAPNLAVLEGDNILQARHAPSGLEVNTRADLIRASVRIDQNLTISRLSIEGKALNLQTNLPAISGSLGQIKAQRLEIHARPNPEQAQDLGLAITTEQFDSRAMPTFSGSLSAIARKGLMPAILTAPNPTRTWLEMAGQLDQMRGIMTIGQKTLKLSGDLTFGQTGYANGDIALKILNSKPEAGKNKLKLAAKTDGLNGPLTALQLMGKPVSDGDLIGSQVDLKIRDGQINAGFLPLGRLPALQ
jgi:hypothetical protein